MIKPVKKEVYTLDSFDLDSMVHKTWPAVAPNKEKSEYDRGWNFAENMESGNHVAYTFLIEDNPIEDFEAEELVEFSKGDRHSMSACTLLEELCRRKIIEPGEYIVEVSW